MNRIDLLNKILQEDEQCNYCNFRSDCKGLTNGPNGPIYPPCESGRYDIDVEQYAEDNDIEIAEVSNDN